MKASGLLTSWAMPAVEGAQGFEAAPELESPTRGLRFGAIREDQRMADHVPKRPEIAIPRRLDHRVGTLLRGSDRLGQQQALQDRSTSERRAAARLALTIRPSGSATITPTSS